MGIPVTKGGASFDRNIARLEIFSDGDSRDDWRIVVHFQDALYDGDERVTNPEFGTKRAEATYGEIKDMKLPNIGAVSSLFAPIRELGYALLQQQEEREAEADAARAALPPNQRPKAGPQQDQED